MRSVRTIIRHGITLLFITFGICCSATAQSTDQKSGKESTFQLSFVPGLSTSDSHSTSRISFNIIGGYNGAFRGVELGSVFNGNRYDVSGLQLSGAVNMNQQRATGAILSGAFNYGRDFSGGLMASGGININRKEATGVLLSGGVNIVEELNKGLMSAGGINITGDANGLLIAGGMNFASGEASGVSIAPFNITREQTGLQIGVMNIAEKLQGTQIGVVNVATEGGTPIGLLSFAKNGRYDVDIWGSETGFINGGMRIGTEEVYNVLSIGYNPFHGDDLWQVGLGLGYYYPFNQKGTGLETDLMNYHVNHDGKWTTETSNHIQWRMHYVHAYTRNVRLFVGPSVNLLIADKDLSASHLPYTVYKHSSGSNQLRWWIGGTVGIELF